MEKIKCPCGKEVEIKDTSNIGEIIKRTGFYALMSHEGRSHFLCPECFNKAQEHAEAIMEIVKDKQLYFPGLLTKETRDTPRKEEEK